MSPLAKRIKDLDRRKTELEKLAELETAVCALEHRMLAAPDQASIAAIVEAVCESFRVPRAAIGARNRVYKVALARQACFWLCCRGLHMPYTPVGRLFQRDHGAVMHGCRVIQGNMDCNDKFKLRMEGLLQTIQQQIANEQSATDTDKRPMARAQ